MTEHLRLIARQLALSAVEGSGRTVGGMEINGVSIWNCE